MTPFDCCARKLAPLALLLASAWIAPCSHAKGEWIDVHVHPMGDKGSAENFDQLGQTLVDIMDNNNMKGMVVMPPPGPNPKLNISDELSTVKAKYGPRLAFMAAGSLNKMLLDTTKTGKVPDEVRQRFEAFAEAQLAKGAIGFGEIATLHLSLTPTHPFLEIPPDHPLLMLLADIAARHDVPIDLHCDPIPEDMATPSKLISSLNPSQLKGNIAALEKLLDHNPKAIIVWAHIGSHPLGFLPPQLTRELLGRHPNLYFSIRPVDAGGSDPIVSARGSVDKDWVAVLRDFPDRFVIGTDSFIVAYNFTGNDAVKSLSMYASKSRDGVATLLAALPDDLARKIGYENAIRIYKLNSIKP